MSAKLICVRARPPFCGAAAALALLTAVACGSSSKDKGPAAATEASPPASRSRSAGAPAAGAGAAAPSTEPTGDNADNADNADDAGAAALFGGPPPTPKPSDVDPPEVVALKERIIRGERSTRAQKEAQTLSHKYAKNTMAAYMLGQLYCSRLWMGDCMEAFRKALALEPALRNNPFLIRAVVAGLGNDSDHLKVRRFLVQEIGKPAAPFVEEVLQGNYRQQVKDRATSILNEFKK